MSILVDRDGQLTFHFEGRLDTPASTKLEPEVSREVQGTKLPVVFDLKGVAFVASIFIRLCIATARRVGTGRFSVVNVSPEVKKVCKTAGLDQIVRTEPSPIPAAAAPVKA